MTFNSKWIDPERLRLYELGLLSFTIQGLSVPNFRVSIGGMGVSFRTDIETAALASWIGPRGETLVRATALAGFSLDFPNLVFKTSLGKSFSVRCDGSLRKKAITLYEGDAVVKTWMLPEKSSLENVNPFLDLCLEAGSLWLAVFEYTERFNQSGSTVNIARKIWK